MYVSLFILATISFFASPLYAWNEDYRSDLNPIQRTVCLKNSSNPEKEPITLVRSTQPDEPCSPGEARYRLIVGKNPKGALAFIPLTNMEKLYPPWVVSWPADDEFKPRLWHFTCFATSDQEVLGTLSKKRHHRGEITTPADRQSCEAASVMADQVCRDQLGGNELLEQCGGVIPY
ncbi:MAG: hypothetical protein JNK65_04285 [Deltaproteobacteria bacterium]|nr:hypothetical protein [Deltaproteobacteria bacterium]